MKPLKICFIYTLYKGGQGGGKVSVDLLYEALENLGHNVSILTTRKPEKYGGKKVISISRMAEIIPDNVLKLGTGITDVLLARGIRKRIAEENPDIIHVQDDYIIPAVTRAAIPGIPVVVTMRQGVELNAICSANWPPLVARLYRKRLALNLRAFQKASAVIAVSDTIRDGLKARGIEAETIYNLIPLWEYREPTQKTTVDILAPGRITIYKGFATLVRAMALVATWGLDFRLTIAGEGPELDNVKGLIKTQGLGDKVFITGNVDFTVMADLYRDCDIVVFPTEVPESLGRVSIEAMTMGRPVIASRIGAIPEIVVDGESGLLVPPGNHQDLASAIKRLILDEKMRLAMGRNGRTTIMRKLNRGTIVDRLLKIYYRLLVGDGE